MTDHRPNKKWFFLLLQVALLLAAGCGDDERPATVGDPPTAHAKTVIPATLRIVFKWPGDDFASRQNLSLGDRIGDLITQRGAARIIRTGTGMGWMDILVEVEDKASAIPALEAIIREIDPAIVFTIEEMKDSP